MGSQVGGEFHCQWRCKETPGEEEETESTRQLIDMGSKNKGGIDGAY